MMVLSLPPPVPVLVLSADSQDETRQSVLVRGANGFLTKPLDSAELEIRLILAARITRLRGEVRAASERGKCKLSDDEARSLIIHREIGMLDNATYRQINHMDVLTASGHLRRLRDLGILKQHGKGASTFYKPGDVFFHPEKQKRRKKRESPNRLLNTRQHSGYSKQERIYRYNTHHTGRQCYTRLT